MTRAGVGEIAVVAIRTVTGGTDTVAQRRVMGLDVLVVV